jgi:hypothetical protein
VEIRLEDVGGLFKIKDGNKNVKNINYRLFKNTWMLVIWIGIRNSRKE